MLGGKVVLDSRRRRVSAEFGKWSLDDEILSSKRFNSLCFQVSQNLFFLFEEAISV